MPPSKYTNAEEQRKAERKKWEAKNKPKPVLGERLKAMERMERKEQENQGKRFHSGDY
jgi:hypothetical protein